MYGQNTKLLVFGIDMDDTISAAPELFEKMIDLIKSFGHDVWIVTARNENDWCPLLKKFEEKVDQVVFSSTRAKEDIAEVDIWIDDFPLSITHGFENAGFVPGKKARKWCSI